MTLTEDDDCLLFADVDGPVLAVSCNKCRKVAFTDDVEDGVALVLQHAGECGSSSVVIAELLAPRTAVSS